MSNETTNREEKQDVPSEAKANEKASKSSDLVEQKNDESHEIPEIPDEVLEKLPPSTQKLIRSSMSMVMSGSMPHPIYSKIEPEHISKIIESTEKDSERDFQDRQQTRKWNFMWLVVVCVFIVAVFSLFIFSGKAEYVVPIGTAILGFAGGLGSGFGIGRYGRKR